MLRELKGLAKETAIYGLSTVLGRMLSFLLTPLFTHLLLPVESGVVQTVYSYIGFLALLYALGLDVAYLRLGRRDGRPDDGSFTAAWGAVVVLAFAASALIHVFAAPLALAIGAPESAASVVRCAAWILALDAAALIPYTELRGSHHAGTYAGIKVFNIALTLVLSWVFVKQWGWGVRGVFLANLAASAASLIMLLPVLLPRLAAPDRARLRAMLAFGLPLAAAGLGSMVVQVADRPIMTRLAGLGPAGIYGSCYKLGIFMMLLVNMFDQAWKPFVLERADRAGVDRLIARVLTYFAVLACWAFLGVAFFVDVFVKSPIFAGHALFGPAYWSGLPIVPVVTLGYLFNGLYYVMLAPLMIDKRMGSVGVATWIGALINIGVNVALIPRWGMMAAAWATCVAYIAMAAAVWVLGRRTRATPYEWTRLGGLAAWTALLWTPASHLSLPARAALLLAYPVGLRLSGFLHDEELTELAAMFRLPAFLRGRRAA
ncbi:MAG: oligosaccharide flippase family protein [Elusimicrobia bacterium]|nr:oligosaccharide flippase family protein [Elusimicrobiota bacterium]